jgi:hypothetical protein
MENTTLKTVNSKGEPVVVPVPKGANVNVIFTGLHYNRGYLRRDLIIPHIESSEILARPTQVYARKIPR